MWVKLFAFHICLCRLSRISALHVSFGAWTFYKGLRCFVGTKKTHVHRGGDARYRNLYINWCQLFSGKNAYWVRLYLKGLSEQNAKSAESVFYYSDVTAETNWWQVKQFTRSAWKCSESEIQYWNLRENSSNETTWAMSYYCKCLDIHNILLTTELNYWSLAALKRYCYQL